MRKLLWVAAIGAIALPAWGFDVHTHAAMTAAASVQSILTGSPETSVLALRLGLVDPAFLRGKQYLDLANTTAMRDLDLTRKVFLVLQDPAAGLTIPDAYTLTGWIVQGAIREDDNPIETPDSDEPGGVFKRVYGHFFDPQNNRGLTFGVATLGARAVDWGLLQGAPADGRQNHFNVTAAREAMWRAITLTATDATGGFTGSAWPSNWPNASAEALRQAYWATTFRALGDVVHLVQDMGQPQHTRNDLHSGLGCTLGGCLAGHASFFEQYLKARTLQIDTFSLDEGFLELTATERNVKAPQLTYSGYPKLTFNSYADYFGTGAPGANITGNGLANYSNRGFYSFGTNINSSDAISAYPSPDPRGIGLSQEIVSGDAFKDMSRRTMPQGSLTVLTGTVHDFAVPSQEKANVKLSSVGIWDQFLQQRGSARSYSLNYYNYDDQADLLVPRAVAYSAGLIDYFFRGQMEISLPDSRVYAIVDHAIFAGSGVPSTDVNGYKGFSKIRLKLRNTTAVINAPDGGAYPQDIGVGTLVAVAKFHRNLNYKDDLSGERGGPAYDEATSRSDSEEIVVSNFIPVGSVPSDSPVEYEFTFSQEIPINATDLYLQVVFRGALGQEADAVVVATRDISEPTYWALMNASDYFLTADGHAHFCNGTTQCYGGAMDGALQFFLGDYTTTPGAIILLRDLPTAAFSRFAFLTDAQPDPQQLYNLAVSGAPDPWMYQVSENQWNFSAAGSADRKSTPVTRQRNVYNVNLYPVINEPGGVRTTLRNLDPDEMSEPLLYPKPLPFSCISVQPMGCEPP